MADQREFVIPADVVEGWVNDFAREKAEGLRGGLESLGVDFTAPEEEWRQRAIEVIEARLRAAVEPFVGQRLTGEVRDVAQAAAFRALSEIFELGQSQGMDE